MNSVGNHQDEYSSHNVLLTVGAEREKIEELVREADAAE